MENGEHSKLQNGNIPTNEQIIDDLTKDMQDTCIDSVDKGDNISETNEAIVAEDEFYVDEDAIKERDSSLSKEQLQELFEMSQKYKSEGNEIFRNKDYNESIHFYTNALRTCPLVYSKERAVMYSNRAAANRLLGSKDLSIKDCSKALELDSTYVKVYLRRAVLYEETDKLSEALEDYKKILELHPEHKEASVCCMRLTEKIKENEEKLKNEMLGKLKDVGNLFLKPFGLSTSNFQMTENSTGGYSVNFVPSPKDN